MCPFLQADQFIDRIPVFLSPHNYFADNQKLEERIKLCLYVHQAGAIYYYTYQQLKSGTSEFISLYVRQTSSKWLTGIRRHYAIVHIEPACIAQEGWPIKEHESTMAPTFRRVCITPSLQCLC
jgi:hypothetical protein